MSTCVILISAFLFFHSSISLAQERVAVVGAGPAGIAAAQKLLEKGYLVTVFEKEDRVGGKCLTVPMSVGTGPVELGAIQIAANYDVVLEFANKLGHRLRDYWPSRSLRSVEGQARPVYSSIGAEYLPLKNTPSILKEINILNKAIKRYKKIRQSNLEKVPLISEFNQSFEVWADSLGLKHFKEITRLWITSYGYGDLREVPAYIPLYLLDSALGLAFITRSSMNLRMLETGFGPLLEDMVEKYHIPVKTGVRISLVERTPEQVTLTFEKAGETSSESFDRLVVACGLECVQEFLPKQTLEEAALLKELQFTPYDVVIAHIPSLPKGGYVLPENLNTPGHVSLISKNAADGEDVILYVPRGGIRHVGDPTTRSSEEQLQGGVKADLARFGFQDVRILRIQYWDNYFPHFGNPYAYNLLAQIQGENRTVYVGSMGIFEIVEKAMIHAIDVVEKHIIRNGERTQDKPVSRFKRFRQVYKWYFGALRKDAT